MDEQSFTEEVYKAAIPRCCSRQTLQEHMEMMLCWGLAAAIRAGHKMDCSGCDLKNPAIPSDHSASDNPSGAGAGKSRGEQTE